MENVELQPVCISCGKVMPGSYIHRKYCSASCKSKWRRDHGPKGKVNTHNCRICGKEILLKSGQGNKWLCSDRCRTESNTRSVRTFHERRPKQEAIYRHRAKLKLEPDSNAIRFRKLNPDAPRECESCGENRVLEVSHKPGYERIGSRRSSRNCKWPEMVWVLCPTCHRLIDRMNYDPAELGLKL